MTAITIWFLAICLIVVFIAWGVTILKYDYEIVLLKVEVVRAVAEAAQWREQATKWAKPCHGGHR